MWVTAMVKQMVKQYHVNQPWLGMLTSYGIYGGSPSLEPWVSQTTFKPSMKRRNLVGGLVAIFCFPIYWVSNHPNWRAHIFQRGWNHQPAIFWSHSGILEYLGFEDRQPWPFGPVGVLQVVEGRIRIKQYFQELTELKRCWELRSELRSECPYCLETFWSKGNYEFPNHMIVWHVGDLQKKETL